MRKVRNLLAMTLLATAVATTAQATAPDQATCFPLSQNFDGVIAPALPAGWVATNAQGTAPLWVTSTTMPDTAPNDAFIDDPGFVSDKLLDTPAIAIRSTTAQISFRNFYNTENTFDGGVLEISSPNINGGTFTDVTNAAVGGSFVAGGYNATISSSFASPISGRMAWSGNSGSYVNTVANLGPNVNGQTIKLRFRMASDNSASATGWRVDTITVSDQCPTPTPTPTSTPMPTPCIRLAQNFDGVTPPALPPGWVATNAQGTSPLWVTSNASADTTPNDAFVDDPGAISDKLLDTPPVTVTSGSAQVIFRNNYNTESTFDGGVLEISIGGGAFNDILTAGGSFVTGGYSATISTNFGSPISGRMAWSGNSGGYITSRANLGPNVAGQTVKLRFRMASDSSVSATGWRIDTISITDGAACTSPTPTPSPIPSPSPSPPMIVSPLAELATVNQPFTYQFETVGATSLDASTPVPGLTFDRNLTAITGTPTAAGTFSIGLSAMNSGGTTNATLTLTVQPAPAAGPVIASRTAAKGRVGQPFKFYTYITGGDPAARITATGLPPGLMIDATNGLISGTPTAAGSSAVTLTVTDGSFVTSATLQLTFTADPVLPVIVSANLAPLTRGQFFSYEIIAPGNPDPSDPTTFDEIGALPPGLGFDGIDTISGTYTGPLLGEGASGQPDLAGGTLGSIQLFGTNSHGTAAFQLLFLAAPSGVVNISTRLSIQTGENVLIGGFIITGNAPKVVITRAIGPSLGIPGALLDPTLELHDSGGHVVVNDNWRDTQEQIVRDTGIPPADDRESAIVIGLDPGAYTAIVAGKNGTTGIGLVEGYDLGTASLDPTGNSKLANISTRGTVLTGDNVMIGGFIVAGQATRVIVRAIGPSLNGSVAGALQDTTLELHNGVGTTIFANDDWRSDQQAEIIATGIPPTDNRESAIVANLTPGNYTAIVRGKNGTTGVALVEVYVLP